MSRFPTFELTERQIRGIANIVLHEQGTIAGWYAEASQIANLAELRYGGDPVKAVCSGWYAKGKERFNAGTSNITVIEIVRRVLCKGFRTLPRYVDEHDCMSDIKTARNGSQDVKGTKAKWKPHETVIKNKMGGSYYFFCFPGDDLYGVDPFGYTSKENRKKYGDFCYTVAEAQAGKEVYDMPVLKNGSDGKAVKVWQLIAGVKDVNGHFRDVTEKATKNFQKKHGLKVDGIVGPATWAAGLGTL